MSDEVTELKQAEQTAFESRKERRLQQRSDNNWVAGLLLIVVGGIFLVSNFTGFAFHNWWALFILIPFLAAAGNAARIYQSTGQFTREARQSLIGSLFPLYVALIFLFNLDWGKVWPGFLVLGGIAALFGRD